MGQEKLEALGSYGVTKKKKKPVSLKGHKSAHRRTMFSSGKQWKKS